MRRQKRPSIEINGYTVRGRVDNQKTMEGVVFECLQKSVGASRVVKIVRPEFVEALGRPARSIQSTVVDEFEEEIRRLGKLTHPNIVALSTQESQHTVGSVYRIS